MRPYTMNLRNSEKYTKDDMEGYVHLVNSVENFRQMRSAIWGSNRYIM